MITLKCKMCGGDLSITDEEMTVCECEYCGSKQTVPKVDDEKKMKLYERANKLRYNCDFDKAAGVYESIIADFSDEAEAYWGLVLCKYGIEYVDDPATGKKVPTCHRSSFESIMDDSNFDMVMESADHVARNVYREEAKYIEELRKGIIEVSSKEEPYDIFICYKETDENGERTIDSVIAQDVYTDLTNAGYRVFFSRISLEDKLGVEYEPYIFAALNSAKIMLAFGTSYDYYNAVWVKNEWSRYLKLMAEDRTRHLIPCFKNIDAYDIPKEFAKLQAQDMGKIGATQDLLRGIEKILPKKKEESVQPVQQVVQQVVQTVGGTNVEALLKRGFMALEDKDWDKAEGFFEDALNQDAENVNAYLGKLLAEYNVSTKENLADLHKRFDDSKNYQKLVKFADSTLQEELNSYLHTIDETMENDRKESIYQKAISQKDNNEYSKAMARFKTIRGYKDSDAQCIECENVIKQLEAEKRKRDELVNKIAVALKKSLQGDEVANIKKEIEECNKKIASAKEEIARIESIEQYLPELETKKCQLDKEYDDIQLKLDTMQNEYNSLGIFAGKRKKELTESMDILKSKKHNKVTEIEELNRRIDGNDTQSLAYKKDENNKNIITMTNSLETLNDKLEVASKKAEGQITYEEAKKLLKDSDIKKYLSLKYADLWLIYGLTTQSDNGNKVKLGKYHGETIEWRILKRQGKRLLLITEKAIDTISYNVKYESITWEQCSLRKYLNNDFLNDFTSSERKIIQTTHCKNSDNHEYNTAGGNDTEDKIFLLSIDEAKTLFSSDAERICKPTSYALSKKPSTNDKGAVYWRLRSPGLSTVNAAYVSDDGYVYAAGSAVNYGNYCVRPALWVNLESII